MREALLSSNIIGQAQGFLMSSRSCSAEAAFGLLRTMSMQTNRKVRDVAHSLVESETDVS
jgi:AmiR/NasT family two-component response regulator